MSDVRISRTARLAGATLSLVIAATAAAQRNQDLKTGDPAPPLSIDAWVEGGELNIEQGKVYVVLFLETASSVGHMTGKDAAALGDVGTIYLRHLGKDLRVIMVSPETSDRLNEVIADTRQMLGFNIAADRRNATWRAWVGKAGVSPPAAFIVNRDSNIAWIGSPDSEDLAAVLAKVIDGRHDPRLQERAQPLLDAARRARKVRNWRLAEQNYDQVIGLSPRVFADVALEKFTMYVSREHMGDPERAYTYARELIAGSFKDDTLALRVLAEKIATDPRIADEDRDLDVAERAAEAALADAGRNDPPALATMALIQFTKGDLRQAVRLQTDAYLIAIPVDKPTYKRDLRRYKEALQGGR